MPQQRTGIYNQTDFAVKLLNGIISLLTLHIIIPILDKFGSISGAELFMHRPVDLLCRITQYLTDCLVSEIFPQIMQSFAEKSMKILVKFSGGSVTEH